MATTLVRIQLLSKTSTDFAATNPVLLDGEVGVANAGASVPVMKVGDGVRPWSALPDIVAAGAGADYIAGPVTTLPPGSPATVVIDNTVSPPTINFGIPTGATGAGAPGPVGPVGPIGPTGPANTLAIGSVTTGAPGSLADATITGAAPNQTLNLVIPSGIQGPQGIQGPPGADGSGVPANPAAQVGLAAVNGVAATLMRSDSAPALSQAIAPTWTSEHIFANAAKAFSVKGVAPNFYIEETDAALNEKMWRIIAADGKLYFDTRLDAGGAGNIWLQVNRVGVTIDSILLGAPTVIGPVAGVDAMLYLRALNPYIRFDNAAGVNYGYVQCSPAGITLFHGTGVVQFYSGGVVHAGLSAAGDFNVTGNIAAAASVRGGAFTNPAGNAYIAWTAPASLPFGTAYIQGPGSSGYTGLCVYDNGAAGGLQITLMSNGAAGGVFCVLDSKWLITRTGANDAQCYYNLSAVSFITTSSRTIKRETGTPTGAAQMLAKLRPILFRRLEKNAPEELGLIAEEVREVCPQLSNGKSIAYDRLAVLLLAEWQASHGIAA